MGQISGDINPNVSPQSGNNNQQVSIQVGANPSTTSRRQKITVTGANKSIDIWLEQAGAAPAKPTIYVHFTSAKYLVANNGLEIDLEFKDANNNSVQITDILTIYSYTIVQQTDPAVENQIGVAIGESSHVSTWANVFNGADMSESHPCSISFAMNDNVSTIEKDNAIYSIVTTMRIVEV